MNKGNLITLMNGYVNNYKREIIIDQDLRQYGITIEDTENPLVWAAEDIFNYLHKDLTDMLIELADVGFTVVYINDKEKLLDTTEKIYNFLFEE